jgi:hypothetical protein
MRSLFITLAISAVLGGAAFADENLVEKREKCHADARQRIKPKGRVSMELSKALLAKRQDYVRDCMDGKLSKSGKKKS